MTLNKVCDLDDWQDAELRSAMRVLEPYMLPGFPDYPAGREHRKSWEYAQLMTGLRKLGALRPDAIVLGVAAGHENPLYELTNHVRWVFATDIYGAGNFTGNESEVQMLRNPDRYAPGPWNRNRLVVQYMDARDLRFEADTFDVVFSLSSIEHFGGVEGTKKGMLEMQRVLKPGGIMMITTECIVNGAEHMSTADFELFTPETLSALLAAAPSMKLVEPPVFAVGQSTLRCAIPLEKAVRDGLAGHVDYPHIVLHYGGRQFTSISLFLKKTD
jgi:SAM-dependent methyltransferase